MNVYDEVEDTINKNEKIKERIHTVIDDFAYEVMLGGYTYVEKYTKEAMDLAAKRIWDLIQDEFA